DLAAVTNAEASPVRLLQCGEKRGRAAMHMCMRIDGLKLWLSRSGTGGGHAQCAQQISSSHAFNSFDASVVTIRKDNAQFNNATTRVGQAISHLSFNASMQHLPHACIFRVTSCAPPRCCLRSPSRKLGTSRSPGTDPLRHFD